MPRARATTTATKSPVSADPETRKLAALSRIAAALNRCNGRTEPLTLASEAEALEVIADNLCERFPCCK